MNFIDSELFRIFKIHSKIIPLLCCRRRWPLPKLTYLVGSLKRLPNDWLDDLRPSTLSRRIGC